MSVEILTGDCRTTLATLPAGSVQTCVTSPPYFGLRDYGHAGQIGLEPTPSAYVAEMVAVFREVRRVLRNDGTLFLNLGDSYATQPGKGSNVPQTKWKANAYPESAAHRSRVLDGYKPKDLLGIPWRVAFALQAGGWYLRSGIVWEKPNAMPESVQDRPSTSHEFVFLLAKRARYYYDANAIKEPDGGKPSGNGFVRPQRLSYAGRGNAEQWTPGGGRNARTVWTIATQPYGGAHFATMPPELAERCIKAGSRPGDTVLDPFGGAGTTGLVADRLGRDAILCELNPAYATLARDRMTDDCPLFVEVAS